MSQYVQEVVAFGSIPPGHLLELWTQVMASTAVDRLEYNGSAIVAVE